MLSRTSHSLLPASQILLRRCGQALISSPTVRNLSVTALRRHLPGFPRLDPFRVDPFSELQRLHAELDRVYRNVLPTEPQTPEQGKGDEAPAKEKETGFFAPRWDVRDAEDKLLIEVDLPGVKKDGLKVEVKENILRLTGSREEAKEEKNGDFHIKERVTGMFSRSLRLPDSADLENIKAVFKDGVLEVSVPKTPAPEGATKEVPVE
uniref:SHSP domain-containing protein n=1 Tax=Chromera velia CCMP2878 TaxID=1169474 RepID=A0A0G4I127_9ALVE|mmetsp:Transcript_32596/g.64640  ORF Transcript_32596/g.64640 Transcript_32596/m.64640 type:complete len:207 (+) Transcript_32596:178-798(+)|eukprot:Cvel_6.t1-p1 / transcript=Cvel_6.t1 / gene=Cvel_6 / organism=Chromera_velia_CCMP2878 / gene_product=18.3 kDa class I heat shock protein, putative / transcript_product=18.3 kDa class I heat shock protein, putative / location=Cvel_scaffold5:37062-37679(-) / protein_length=206 / sequence_SO=supercontig / SO=protein_coding / is_pseudo=false